MSLALTLTSIVLTQYRASTPVEVYIAPIVAPANIIGMGGAAQALATGSGAILQNPAAMAVRYDYNGVRYFDWDFSLDVLASAGRVDVENSGRNVNGEKVGLIEASLGFNIGRLGLGVAFDYQTIRSCADGGSTCDDMSALQVGTTLGVLALAYNFLDGEVVAGASLIIPSATFKVDSESVSPSYSGSALALGVVVRPHGHPMRFGMTYRLQTDANRDGAGDRAQVGDRLLPDHLRAPWQLATGVACSFGDKPLNLRNAFGDARLAAETLDPTKRSYVVVAADVVLIGQGADATGRGAWLAQEEQTAGRHISVSVRVGAESEFWPDVMRGRVGTYYEPSRFDNADGRIHGTFGFDLRLLELIWVWRLTGAFDKARDYQNLSVSLGFWH